MIPGVLQKYHGFIGLIIIAAILSVSVLSTIHFGMDTSSAEAMRDCPFAGTQGLCSMDSSLDHASMWHGLLAVIPIPAAVSVLIATVLVLVFFLSTTPLWGIFELIYDRIRVRLRHLAYTYLHPMRPLAEAFSDGILNPKLF